MMVIIGNAFLTDLKSVGNRKDAVIKKQYHKHKEHELLFSIGRDMSC